MSKPIPTGRRSKIRRGEPAVESEQDIIERLRYIAESPSREHGGFHEQAIQIAKDAIAVLAVKQENVVEARKGWEREVQRADDAEAAVGENCKEIARLTGLLLAASKMKEVK